MSLKRQAVLYGATDLKPSNRKHKKYMVLFNNEWIHFGDNRYQDYTVHNDDKRRDRYRARASKIVDKNGNLTYLMKSSPNFWSYHLLW